MSDTFRLWLTAAGLSDASAVALTPWIGVLAVLVPSILLYLLCSRIILSQLIHWAERSSIRWDDALIAHRVIHRLSYLAPALAAYLLSPWLLDGQGEIVAFVRSAVEVVVVMIGVWVLQALLSAAYDIYAMLDAKAEMPIRGPIQAAKLVVALVGALLVGAILLDQSPMVLLTGLGALGAVLMLVFRDPILGFVAGIHLVSNEMVAPGDWIEMPSYDADGDVIEVGLTTVKVRNFDNTITMVPTHALISESFKNWRGMSESGGRRIMRAIHLDINSIRFCTEAMVERYARIDLLAEYMQRKRDEIARHNGVLEAGSLPINGRRLTNVGTFRAYVAAYLRRHPMIDPEMSFLVRQLPPTELGLPIQVYVFCTETVWERYEAIQADIFDHLLATVPEFDLKVFQSPTGSDFGTLTSQTRAVPTAPGRP